MPLVTDAPRGPAPEDRDYRPVEAEWLEGDTYRVVSEQPRNERWEYPSGARVFAVRLHAGDEVVVIVAPVPDPEAAPAERPVQDPPARRWRPRRPQGRARKPKDPGEPKTRTRSGPTVPWRSVQGARLAQTVVMLVVMVTAGFAWLGRDTYFLLQPADPIRASIVAASVILIAGLWRVTDLRELRALGAPSAMVGATFVLSLFLARCHA